MSIVIVFKTALKIVEIPAKEYSNCSVCWLLWGTFPIITKSNTDLIQIKYLIQLI